MAAACRDALDEIDDMLRTYEQKGVLKLWEMLDTQRLRQLRREINKTLSELQGIIEIETTAAVTNAYETAFEWGAFVIQNTAGRRDMRSRVSISTFSGRRSTGISGD